MVQIGGFAIDTYTMNLLNFGIAQPVFYLKRDTVRRIMKATKCVQLLEEKTGYKHGLNGLMRRKIGCMNIDRKAFFLKICEGYF
jgi:hypothetical protein